MPSNIDGLLSEVTIHQIFRQLGGQISKHNPNRGRAFWRDGDREDSIQFYSNTNLWIDHAQHQEQDYPGILGLIQLVKGFDNKAQSVSWLEDYLGKRLEAPSYTSDQEQSAKRWQQAMIGLKQGLIERYDEAKLAMTEEQIGDPWDESVPNHWRDLCSKQKTCRADLERLRSLRGKQLVEVYNALPEETKRATFRKAKPILAETERFMSKLESLWMGEFNRRRAA
jgi:hypothetical protein